LQKVDKLSCFMKFLKSLCFKKFHMFSSTTNWFLFVVIFTHHALSHNALLLKPLIMNGSLVMWRKLQHWTKLVFFNDQFFIAPSYWMRMCRFWVHPSNWWVVLKSTHLLVGFLFKIWMLGNLFNHASISIYFIELSLAFLYHMVFISLWNVKKTSYELILNDFFG